MDYKDIEKSIIKKYRKQIWGKVIRAIKDFKLIKDGDKIAVCISGGKDSFLLAKCLEEVKRHNKIKFDLEFIVMNPGYKKENLDKIMENAKKMNLNITIFENKIFDITANVDGNPCYLCARMRRGALYSKAKELRCNKIALGHHFNDVIETIMLNMLYTGQFSSMMPKLKSDNFEGMELIRPLYYVKEEDIISWSKSNELEFIDCACKITKEKDSSKRYQVKKLINKMLELNPDADWCIYKSSTNVNIDTIIEYKKNNKIINFLDKYDEK